MSDLTAFLLMYLTEEDCFWMLIMITQTPKYALRSRLLPGFPLLEQSYFIFELMMKKHLPRVRKHLNKLEIQTMYYGMKWFMTVYCDAFPFDLMIRIWDLYLLEGYNICYSIGIAAMKIFEGLF